MLGFYQWISMLPLEDLLESTYIKKVHGTVKKVHGTVIEQINFSTSSFERKVTMDHKHLTEDQNIWKNSFCNE